MTSKSIKKSKTSKKEVIRTAAYHCFQEHGYHGTKVENICKTAETSKGSFYWHYKSKNEVFVDILVHWAQEVMTELIRQFEDALSKKDYLAAISEALKLEIRRGRAIVPLWLEFTIRAKRQEEIQQALAKFYRRARAAIAELLRPILRHLFSEEQLEGIATTILGAYTGIVTQELADPEGIQAERAVESILSVLAVWIRFLQQNQNQPLA